MANRLLLLVAGFLLAAGAQAAGPDQERPQFCKIQMTDTVDPDLTDDQLADRFTQSQQAVAKRYQSLESQLPDKARKVENQSQRLTKKDVRQQYRAWLTYQAQYCTYVVKRYDLTRNEENRVLTFCMLNLNQTQLCVLKNF